MIIACPSCTSPYQLRDNDIAPLVQVECPSCNFRVILDFEAANDPSLIEAGTQTTNGYRDEAAYNEHAGSAAAASAPAPAAAPTPAQPQRQPQPTPAPTPRPAAPAAAAPTPTPAPTPAPAAAAPAEGRAPKKTVAMMGGVPAALRPKAPEQPPAELEPAHAEVESEPMELDMDVELEVDEPTRSQAEMMADAVERAAAADVKRQPPHTPAGSPSSVQPDAEGDQPLFDVDEGGAAASSVDLQAPPELEMAPSPSPKPEKKESSLGRTFLLLILVLLIGAGALVGVAYVQTGDPNPLPLIDQFLQFVEKKAAGQ